MEWQETREIISTSYDADLNTAANQAIRLNIMAREVLTEQQFATYDAIMNKHKSFGQVAKKLSISVPRVSELWHLAVAKVEKEWALRNSKS